MNREEKLKLEFNEFLSEKLFLEKKDYYSELDTEDFIGLKTLLSNINNIVTLKLTLKFIDTLARLLELSDKDKSMIAKKIQAINPSANGFDIEIVEPVKVVAEVKGNIPVNGGATFGSAQKSGILKDLRALKNGKTKSTVDPDNFYKFMVLSDTEATRGATEKLLGSLGKNAEYGGYKFEIVSDDTRRLGTDTIYVVFVGVE